MNLVNNVKKQFDNEEAFKKFLEEEYIKEAEEIEAEWFPNGEVIDAELSEEEVQASYDKLTQKLKRDGEYDFYRDKENKGKRRLVRWRYPFDRTAVAIVVAGLSVILTSLTSAANREAITYRFQYMINATDDAWEKESQNPLFADDVIDVIVDEK